jgi:hypothetical protein
VTARAADPAPVSVGGVVATPGDWSVDRLKTELAADVTSVSYATHGQHHTSKAVSLLSVLKAAGLPGQLKKNPKVDPTLKHPELRLVVLVEGRDGYPATFSLAELMGELGNRPVWLALDEDGKALSGTEGPVKLIVPDDQKPARWVHAVRSVMVIDITKLTTKPAR